MSNVDLIGYAAGFFLMWSFLPQLVKTVRTRRTEDLSVAMLSVTLVSALLYEAYAAILGLTPVIIMNGVFALTVMLQLGFTLYLRARSVASGSGSGPEPVSHRTNPSRSG